MAAPNNGSASIVGKPPPKASPAKELESIVWVREIRPERRTMEKKSIYIAYFTEI